MVMLGSGGDYIKSTEVQTGDMIKFLNEGEWIESQKYKYQDGNPRFDFVVNVEYNQAEKKLRLNATNRTNLINAWGQDTEKWIGKQAKIEAMACLVGGKMSKTIVVTPLNNSELTGEEAWDG